jgi:hypothetical protein
MHKRLSKRIVLIFAFGFLISSGLFIYSGCRKSNVPQSANNSDRISNEASVSADYPTFIKYRCFQNPDSTWGFTIFVNSRPYLHYKKIPLNGYKSGFNSRSEAEKVAGLFVKKIYAGDSFPKLNNRTLDSLENKKY